MSVLDGVISKDEIDGGHALASLVPAADYSYDATSKQMLAWNSSGITQPTQSEIDAEVTRLKALWDNVKYRTNRKYATIGDQLDQLWHDIDDGKLDKTGSWYLAVKAVKDANPKN
jgi:hypothetical protein